jgi:hypothetical protein
MVGVQFQGPKDAAAFVPKSDQSHIDADHTQSPAECWTGELRELSLPLVLSVLKTNASRVG